MGCSGCTRKGGDDTAGGCEARKAPQRAELDALLARLYPTSAWGHPDDDARFGAGVRPGEVTRLAQALAVACRAPTFVRDGGDEDQCAYVYVLCVGRTPCLLDVRDERAPAQLGEGEERVRERYLRVALSTAARLATVQEVVFEADRIATGPLAGALEIRELPRPGVYDAVLLKRMRAAVDLLLASDLLHVDFGLLDVPLAGADDALYRERFGTAPHLVNYLFYAAPPTTSSVMLLDPPH